MYLQPYIIFSWWAYCIKHLAKYNPLPLAEMKGSLPFYLLHRITTCNARQWQLAVSISLFLLLIILRDAPVLLWAGDALLHYHVSAERAGDRWSAVGEKCHEGSCCHHSPPSHPFSPLPHCLPSHNSPPLPPHPYPIPPPSPPHSPCQDC